MIKITLSEPKSSIIKKLIRIKKLSNQACKRASKNQYVLKEAVNWADLHCTETSFCINEMGEVYVLINLSEASPDSQKLKLFIHNYLKNYIDNLLVVETEW